MAATLEIAVPAQDDSVGRSGHEDSFVPFGSQETPARERGGLSVDYRQVMTASLITSYV
jgi:hypothetical protein